MGKCGKKLRFDVLKSRLKTPRTMLSFDIETFRYGERKGEFMFGGVYNGTEYICFTDRESMKRFLTRSDFAGCCWIAHNAEYDINRIFYEDAQLDRYYLEDRFIFARWPVASGLQTNPDGTQKQRYKYISFWDTANIAGYKSVEEIGKLVGKLKGVDPALDEVTEEAIKYNRLDCEIIYDYAQLMQNKIRKMGSNFKSTAASNSMELYQRKYMPRKAGYWELPQHIKNIFSDAYYGGRTEVYRFKEFEKLGYYDINSSYPYAMLGDYPLLDTWVNGPDLEAEGATLVDVKIHDCYYPPLPYRTNKLIFPVGSWRAWYYNCELRDAMELCPEFQIQNIVDGVHYLESAPIFQSYINKIYGLRKETTADFDKEFYKLIMNSLYGKFGLSGVLEKYNGREHVPVERDIPFANKIWSGMIAARARMNLYGLILRTNAIYCDTDSSLTEMEIPTSKKLGDVGLKGIYYKFRAYGNKFYFYLTPDGKPGRAVKGVPKRAELVKEFEGDVFHWKFERAIKYKESLARRIPMHSWLKCEKTLDSIYDKRIMMEDGETRPLEVNNLLF